MSSSSFASTLLTIAAASTVAIAQPVVIPIDPATSNVTATYALQGSSDTDSSPLSGSVTIELDNYTTPTSITLHDYNFIFDETINLFIDLGFFGGSISVTGTDLRVSFDPSLSPTFGPTPIVLDQADLLNVPALVNGNFAYSASGGVCIALSLSGLLCADAFPFIDDPRLADQILATIIVQNGIVSFSSSIDTTLAVDPLNPDLGDMMLQGSVNGSAPVPEQGCRADWNEDGTVNSDDFFQFLTDFFAGAADTDNNGVTNSDDFFAFLDLFFGGCD